MARFTMTAEDHRIVGAAVAAAEARTDGEIVTIAARRSDSYHDVAWGWAVVAAFAVIAFAAAWPGWFQSLYHGLLGGWRTELPLGEFLLILLGHVILKFLAVRYLLAIPRLRIALTPGATRTRRVHARAVTLFRAAAEHRTRGRTGILIYLSLDEHRAEIVADEAISSRVNGEIWGEAMAALLVEVREGRIGTGMARAVERVGAVLAEHLPKSDSNPNELPDRLIEL